MYYGLIIDKFCIVKDFCRNSLLTFAMFDILNIDYAIISKPKYILNTKLIIKILKCYFLCPIFLKTIYKSNNTHNINFSFLYYSKASSPHNYIKILCNFYIYI